MPVGAYVGIGIGLYLVGSLVSLAVAKHTVWGPFDRYNDEDTRIGYAILLVVGYIGVGIFTGSVWALGARKSHSEKRRIIKEKMRAEVRASHHAEVLASASREVELVDGLSPLAGRLALESVRNKITAEGIHNSNIDKLINAQYRELERKGT